MLYGLTRHHHTAWAEPVGQGLATKPTNGRLNCHSRARRSRPTRARMPACQFRTRPTCRRKQSQFYSPKATSTCCPAISRPHMRHGRCTLDACAGKSLTRKIAQLCDISTNPVTQRSLPRLPLVRAEAHHRPMPKLSQPPQPQPKPKSILHISFAHSYFPCTFSLEDSLTLIA